MWHIFAILYLRVVPLLCSSASCSRTHATPPYPLPHPTHWHLGSSPGTFGLYCVHPISPFVLFFAFSILGLITGSNIPGTLGGNGLDISVGLPRTPARARTWRYAGVPGSLVGSVLVLVFARAHILGSATHTPRTHTPTLPAYRRCCCAAPRFRHLPCLHYRARTLHRCTCIPYTTPFLCLYYPHHCLPPRLYRAAIHGSHAPPLVWMTGS